MLFLQVTFCIVCIFSRKQPFLILILSTGFILLPFFRVDHRNTLLGIAEWRFQGLGVTSSVLFDHGSEMHCPGHGFEQQPVAINSNKTTFQLDATSL